MATPRPLNQLSRTSELYLKPGTQIRLQCPFDLWVRSGFVDRPVHWRRHARPNTRVSALGRPRLPGLP